MKLWAIVDKGGVTVCISCESARTAWIEISNHINTPESILVDSGYRCIEIRTYDPSTQVVIDRDAYSVARELIEERPPSKSMYCEERIFSGYAKFLSAGESK